MKYHVFLPFKNLTGFSIFMHVYQLIIYVKNVVQSMNEVGHVKIDLHSILDLFEI